MPSRGRSRKRNTRMDAAVDAMKPFGFDKGQVMKTVKELLKVYGGDDYWPFIEENGYRELIDILIDQNSNKGEDNDEEEERQLQLQIQNNSSQEQEAPASSVCATSNTVADSEPIGSDLVPVVPESTNTEEMENVAPPQSNSSQEQEAPTLSVCTTVNTVANSKPIGTDVVQAVPESCRTEEMENGAPPQSNSSQEQEAPTFSVCTSSNTIANSKPIGSDVVQVVPESGRTKEMENGPPSQRCSPARDMEPVERNGSNSKDIRLDKNSDEKETAIAVSNRDGFAQTNNLSGQFSFAPPSSTVPVSVRPANHRAIRKPCFGWIDDDEDELEFIYLTPALPPPPPPPPAGAAKSGHSCAESKKRRKRMSMWDMKPGDL